MDTKWIDARFEEIERRVQMIEIALGDEIEEILAEKGIIKRSREEKENEDENKKDGKRTRAKTTEE